MCIIANAPYADGKPGTRQHNLKVALNVAHIMEIITMANEQNLIPNSERTPKQRRENAQKAGIASGEARRRKRDLKLAMQALLEADVKDKRTGEIMSGAEAIALAQYRKAMKGDAKAFELVRDTSGQKPVEKVEQVNIDGEYLDKVNELKAFFNGEEQQRDNTTDKKESK